MQKVYRGSGTTTMIANENALGSQLVITVVYLPGHYCVTVL